MLSLKRPYQPKTAQDGPKTPQDAPRGAQDPPKDPPDPPKTTKNRPKTFPKRSKFDASFVFFSHHFLPSSSLIVFFSLLSSLFSLRFRSFLFGLRFSSLCLFVSSLFSSASLVTKYVVVFLSFFNIRKGKHLLTSQHHSFFDPPRLSS